MEGRVYILGAGSGDEGLITVKAAECIKAADVIVYDSLINNKFLSYAKQGTEKIDAGKRANRHTLPQVQINELLAEKAKEGKVVVRLKGGDPFIFGRGGEEALYLLEQGVIFEIIPGVSAINAVTSYAGIPITHRNISSSFHVITGHENPSKREASIDYSVIAKLKGTLVFFMGLSNLNNICSNLIKYGKNKNTPAAVISNGTLKSQKTIVGTLENIDSISVGIEAPALIVIGEVVSLREKLRWFDNRTNFGKKVLVTRSKEQAEKFSKKINKTGLEAIELPMIEIHDNLNTKLASQMYDNIEEYNWIVFTSKNAVNIFIKGLMQYKGDIRRLSRARICTVGAATKKALEKYYLRAEFTPPEFKAEQLALDLIEKVKCGERVLVPASNLAGDIIESTLEQIGAKVEVIPIYDVNMVIYEQEKFLENLNNVDIITFTSPSCVNAFMKNIEVNEVPLVYFENKEIICIGPVTAKALKAYGIINFKYPEKYTEEGLMEILLN